jgi:Fic family protein
MPELMSAFADRIPDHRRKYHPVEFSAILHKELVTILPFIDGNGASILMNLAFFKTGIR